MKIYWIIPAAATIFIAATMAFSIVRESTAVKGAPPKEVVQTQPRPSAQAATATTKFGNGFVITNIKISDPKAADKHLELAVSMETTKDTDLGYTLAAHSNDAEGKIINNLGDFKLSTGAALAPAGKSFDFKFPIPGFDISKVSNVGIAMYKDPKELVQVISGKSDWDSRRAIYPIETVISAP